MYISRLKRLSKRDVCLNLENPQSQIQNSSKLFDTVISFRSNHRRVYVYACKRYYIMLSRKLTFQYIFVYIFFNIIIALITCCIDNGHAFTIDSITVSLSDRVTDLIRSPFRN